MVEPELADLVDADRAVDGVFGRPDLATGQIDLVVAFAQNDGRAEVVGEDLQFAAIDQGTGEFQSRRADIDADRLMGGGNRSGGRGNRQLGAGILARPRFEQRFLGAEAGTTPRVARNGAAMGAHRQVQRLQPRQIPPDRHLGNAQILRRFGDRDETVLVQAPPEHVEPLSAGRSSGALADLAARRPDILCHVCASIDSNIF